MNTRVLFWGGTGHIGKRINDIIHQEYKDLVLLSRTPEKRFDEFNKKFEIKQADFFQPSSINDIINPDDVIIIHIQTREHDISQQEYINAFNQTIKIFKEKKIKQLIFISNLPLENSDDFSQTKINTEIETLIRESSLCYTIVRPTLFMEYLYFYVRGNRANLIGNPNKAFNWISLKDLGGTIKKCVNNSEYFNSTVHVVGPEKISLKEAIDTYIEILKPNAKITPLSVGMMRSMANFSNNPELLFNANWLQYIEETTGEITEEQSGLSNIITILGKETLKEWCESEKHVPA